jgi:hypothetical protein
MDKLDLGDRYKNPLKYLTSPNIDTVSDLESPMITEYSDTESNNINSELVSMLETLSNIINLENRHRNNSEVFVPPLDFKDADTTAKLSFIHSLTQSLSIYLSTGTFAYTHFSEFYQKSAETFLESPRSKPKKDVITKLINCGDGVFLTQGDLKQLSSILIGSCRDTAKDSIKSLSNINKTKLELKKTEFKSLSEEIDRLNVIQEKMIFDNSVLRKE